MKIPISVLVVIHTTKGEVLLLERADHPGFWQSVTGSLDFVGESLIEAASRELLEETGIDAGLFGHQALTSMSHSTEYVIYPEWRHRYPIGTTTNTEHWFKMILEDRIVVRLAPKEHIAYKWVSAEQAANMCFSPSNQEAIRQLNLL